MNRRPLLLGAMTTVLSQAVANQRLKFTGAAILGFRASTLLEAGRQPEHKMLQRFAGEWNFEKESVSEDGSKPENLGTGMVSAELVGEFFVVCRWSGKVYGTDYKAFQSLGFNIKQKKYTGSWIDSTMSYRWELSGTVDEKSQKLTITASSPSPAGGTATFRERYQFNAANSITIIGEMRQGEKWVTFTTTRLTRKL